MPTWVKNPDSRHQCPWAHSERMPLALLDARSRTAMTITQHTSTALLSIGICVSYRGEMSICLITSWTTWSYRPVWECTRHQHRSASNAYYLEQLCVVCKMMSDHVRGVLRICWCTYAMISDVQLSFCSCALPDTAMFPRGMHGTRNVVWLPRSVASGCPRRFLWLCQS